jgi:hypothetical protein
MDPTKEQRMCIEELYQITFSDAAFFFGIITSDESWFYGYDHETMKQSSQWKSPKSQRPKAV